MSLREYLDQHSSTVTILAVVLLVIALGIVVMTSRGLGGGGGEVVEFYYYDLDTGELFASTAADTGTEGVRAYVMSCGECGDYSGMTAQEVEAAGAKIAYLLRTDPNETPPYNVFVKRPEDRDWSQGVSDEANEITAMIQCPDGSPTMCLP